MENILKAFTEKKNEPLQRNESFWYQISEQQHQR